MAKNFFEKIRKEYGSKGITISHLISRNAKVLDVGCGTGELGNRLRTEKNCFVVGIEVNEERARLAKARLNAIVVVDVEELREIPYSAKYFDVIVFADILEHLRFPERVLSLLKKYLKDDGCILVSMPNIANWIVRAKLLFGKFDYEKAGILDRTHLRFFTLKSAKCLLEESGFEITYVTGISGWSYLDLKMPFKNPANFWKGPLSAQFIFKAVKKEIANNAD